MGDNYYPTVDQAPSSAHTTCGSSIYLPCILKNGRACGPYRGLGAYRLFRTAQCNNLASIACHYAVNDIGSVVQTSNLVSTCAKAILRVKEVHTGHGSPSGCQAIVQVQGRTCNDAKGCRNLGVVPYA